MQANSKIQSGISLIKSKFLEPGFDYWFTNHEHIRTPFPKEIAQSLKNNTSTIFLEWVEGLKESELNKMPDTEFAEMFETILFNEAIKLVNTDDQRLTIAYPFMPRLGDFVKHKGYGNGKIIERKEIVAEKNKKLLELTISAQDDDSKLWKTQFELTA